MAVLTSDEKTYLVKVDWIQRWKMGWSMGALLPEGNGQNQSWQTDLGQSTTCDVISIKIFISN